MRTLYQPVSAYEFAVPISGTFPPWYDPTYWTEGIPSRPTIKGELTPIKLALILYGIVLLIIVYVPIGAIVLSRIGATKNKCGGICVWWAVALPLLASLVLYALVHVETRFIGAQTALLWILVYSGMKMPQGPALTTTSRTLQLVAALSAVSVVLFVGLQDRTASKPVFSEAAEALQEIGIKPGQRIGLIWDENWNSGAAEGAFVPRLLRLKIVSEVTDASSFWRLARKEQDKTIEVLASTGVCGILARGVPKEVQAGWTRLSKTDYFFYPLPHMS